MHKTIHIGEIQVGPGAPMVLIAGPCVIENERLTLEVASVLREITEKLDIPLIFKASYDKANRTSLDSFRGPGLVEGLAVLQKVKSEYDLAVLSDVHSIEQVDLAAQTLDVIQIPAFLCRQTDLLLEVARTGKAVNVKKGQFLAPWDVTNITAKIESVGNRNILMTERGVMFGYNNLVVDFRAIPIMQRSAGYPVIFDATHSVQLPGGAGKSSGGQREYAPILAQAAVAAGADGIFIEVHPDPDKALCDGPNALPLDSVEGFLSRLLAIRQAVNSPVSNG